jgi:hypothetical protein
VKTYQDAICRVMNRDPRIPTTEPRIIEAWMRLKFGTLDAIGDAEFKREVRLAAECSHETTPEVNEALARSYGL